jgi:serine/threonine protein phosphatase PrpC
MMHFTVTTDTDIGNTKSTNQDSVLYKHGEYAGGEILMAVICDGMGGLAKGELASATVIKAFSKWFDEELPYELDNLDLYVVGGKWSLMLKDLNVRILEYAQKNNLTMGTTFTGVLFINDQYMVAHVGDTRFYKVCGGLTQLTKDHTFVAREIQKGTITPEQAKTDKRRNLLLQCIGASENLEPDVVVGKSVRGTYFLCSDGLRHEVTENEFMEMFDPQKLTDKDVMHSNSRFLIELAKQRKEKDNISVILIKAV